MTNLKVATGLVTLIALAGVTACAVTPEQKARLASDEQELERRLGEQVENICLPRDKDIISRARENSVVIEAENDESYLLTASRCNNLENAVIVNVETPNRCLSEGDYIITYDTAFPGKNETAFGASKCLVTGIYEWK